MDDFHRQAASPDGRKTICAKCVCEAARRRVARDGERINARRRELYEQRHEARRAVADEWRRRNPEKVAGHKRRHYENHKDAYIERATRRDEMLPQQRRERVQRRRARLAGAAVEPINRQAIYERDEGVCYLCSTPVDRDEFELDHIIPVSRGGSHVAENVAAVHPSCNRRKGARLPEEIGVAWTGRRLNLEALGRGAEL